MRPLILATLASACLTFPAAAQTFLGPDPYLSQADSPFDLSGLGSTAFLENCEDGAFNVPGAHPDSGEVYGPAGNCDSVDGDDGVIDGSGSAGRSFFSGNGPGGIRFTFDADELGALPKFAGIVWTDGGGGCSITFEAFDKNGDSLGTIHQENAGDNSNSGTTAEDRFCGVKFNGGISAIKMSNSGGGIEVDHIQYGGLPDRCYADCDGDDALSLFDFLCFVNEFNAGGGYADCDANGGLDLFDFLCFVNAFNAGC
jgi:hypothetical protein